MKLLQLIKSVKNTKRMMSLLLAIAICVSSAPLPVLAAGTTITYESILEALGEGLGYGVVADTYTQRGHAETSVFVNHLERYSSDPFATSGRAQGAAPDYTIKADVTIMGGHDRIDELEFAVFKKVGDNFVRVSDIESVKTDKPIPANTDNGKATTIEGIEFTVKSSADKKSALYVFQVENGKPVLNGNVNTDNLVVQYGDSAVRLPNPIIATAADNYIGDMHFYGGADQNNVKIMQGMGDMYSDGYSIKFAEGIYLYEYVNNQYVKVDPATTDHTITNLYMKEDDWTYSDTYKKFEFVTYIYENGQGRFTYMDQPIEFSFDHPQDAATSILNDASTFSANIAALGGECTTAPGTAPAGGSNGTVSGPYTENGVVTFYRADVVNGYVSLNSIPGGPAMGDSWGQKGLPISDDEYIVINVVVPNGTTQVNTCALSLRTEGNVMNVTGGWGDGVNAEAYSRVIWNYVTEDDEPYTGTILYGDCPGGLMIAPEASVEVNGVADASSFIVKEITNNGVELHQTLFNRTGKVKTKLNMWPTGGVRFRKMSEEYTDYVSGYGYGWGLQPTDARTVISDAEFIVYTDPNDPEHSTVATFKSDEDGQISVTYTPWGQYTPMTVPVTLEDGFVVADGLPTFDPDPTKYTVDSQGNIDWDNADKVTYYLKETKAPKGYALPENNSPLTSFTIDSNKIKDLTVDPFISMTEVVSPDGWNWGEAKYGLLENKRVYGKLDVKKIVSGNAPANEEFKVTVSFTADDIHATTAVPQYSSGYGMPMITGVTYEWTADYDINYGAKKQIKFTNTAGTNEFHADFTLKNNETLHIHNLPAGTYQVTETLKNGQVYQVVYDQETGEITGTDEPLTTITNKYAFGSLKMNKQVIDSEGKQVDGTGEEFTVTLSIDPVLGSEQYVSGYGQNAGYKAAYTVTHKNNTNENKNVTLKRQADGSLQADIKLRNGDALSFGALPLGDYSVREKLSPGQKNMYVISYLKADGTITETADPAATITNRIAEFKGGIQLKKLADMGSQKIPAEGIEFEIYDKFGHLYDFSLQTNADGVASVKGLPMNTDSNGKPVATDFYLVEKGDTDELLQGAQNYTLGSGSNQITIRALKVTINPSGKDVDKDGNLLENGNVYYAKAGNNGEVINKIQFGSLRLSKKLTGATAKDGDYFTFNIEITPKMAAATSKTQYPYYVFTEPDSWNEYYLNAQQQTATMTADHGKLKWTINLPVGQGLYIRDLPAGSVTITEVGGQVDGKTVNLRKYTISSETTGENGTVTGTQSVTGVIKPFGQWINSFTVTSTASFNNKSTQKGYMKVTKQDVESETGLADVEFGIYTDKACTEAVGEMITGTDGTAVSEELALGTYYVKELENPNADYLMIDTVFEVTVTAANTAQNPAQVNGGPVYNQKGITVVTAKTWDDNNDAAKNRPSSVTANIYRQVNGGTPEFVDSITISLNGAVWSASLTDLPQYDEKGNEYQYSLKELDDKNAEITHNDTGVIGGNTYKVTYSTDTDGVLTITNKLQNEEGAIDLNKVDHANSNIKLSGAVFTVYSDSSCTTEYKDMPATDTNGYAKLEKVPAGTYYVKETKAPAGYILDDSTVYTVTVETGKTTTVAGKAIANKMMTAKVAIVAGKKLEGITNNSATFTFVLSAKDGATLPMPAAGGEEIVVKADETAAFGEIEFKSSDLGEKQVEYFDYVIQEVKPQDPIPGVTYDTSKHPVKISLGYDAQGNLEAKTVNPGTTESPLATGTVADPVWITNTFSDVKVKLKVAKVIAGQAPETPATFSFALEAVTSGAPMPATKVVTVTGTGSVTFDEITYTTPGTYTYKITENNTEIPGYTYDLTPRTVTVKVEDDGTGKLVATVNYPTGKDAFTFTNKFDTNGKITLTGSKSLTGRDLKDGEFSFTVKEKGTNQVAATGTNDANGKIVFTDIVYEDLSCIGKHVYEVTEDDIKIPAVTMDKNTLIATVEVTLDKTTGLLKAELVKTESDELAFTNAYEAEGKITLEGTKTLKGRALTRNDVFSFTVTEHGETVTVGHNDETGSITFTEIVYTQDDIGSHTYVISEDDTTLPGITKDATTKIWTVMVTDNGDGTLNAVTVEEESDSLTFTNNYEATGSIRAKAEKDLTGRVMTTKDCFSFTITENGKVVATGNNNGTASITFTEIVYTLKDLGTHTYVIAEDDTTLPGITKDATTKAWTVMVTDNGDGTLKAVTVEEETDSLTFINNYEATGSIRAKAEKDLTGRVMTTKDCFSFTITENGKVVATGSNNGTASVTFTEILYTLGDIGSHTYVIAEDDTTLPGITKDATTKVWTVMVTDNGDGTLKAVTVEEESDPMTFTNNYEATGSIRAKAEKDLTGRVMTTEDCFSFTITEGGKVVATGNNNGTASVTFTEIVYTQDDIGSHTYVIAEDDTTQPGITKDATTKAWTVIVTDNADGTLTAVTVDEETDSLTFINNYEANGSIQAKAEKDINGRVMTTEDCFSFTITEDGQVVATGNNNGTASVTFTEIVYTLKDLGTHTYVIAEDDTMLPGITKDATTKVWTVRVTDNGDGTLTAVTVAEETDSLTFINNYEAIGSTELKAVKYMKAVGSVPGADEKFDFILEMEDGSSTTVQNGENGIVDFGSIEYTLDDVGTHVYTIREKQLVNGNYITDPTVYEVTVEVEDNGDGTLKVTSAMKRTDADGTVTDLKEEDDLAFVNDYKTAIEVAKEWQGGEEDDITLILYAGDKVVPETETVTDPETGKPIEKINYVLTRDGYRYRFSQLDPRNADGSSVVYRVKEKGISGYMRIYQNVGDYKDKSDYVYDGGTIINRAVTSIRVKKVWEGLSDASQRPEITLTLYRNGSVYNKKPSGPNKDGWYTWNNLPLQYEGRDAVYYVIEEPLPSFTTTYSNTGMQSDVTDRAYDGGTITNAGVPKTGDTSNLALWTVLMILSVFGITAGTVGIARKKQKEE